jgi:hypothetical protein
VTVCAYGNRDLSSPGQPPGLIAQLIGVDLPKLARAGHQDLVWGLAAIASGDHARSVTEFAQCLDHHQAGRRLAGSSNNGVSYRQNQSALQSGSPVLSQSPLAADQGGEAP